MTAAEPNFPDILQHFELTGHFDGAEPHGSGHINDTWLVRINHFDARKRYILQRINRSVFAAPLTVMANVDRVTRHIRTLPQGEFDEQLKDQPAFVPIPTRDGTPCWQDNDGETWRLWPFIYGASTVNNPGSARQAHHAARAFGRFQTLLQDLPGPPLEETIPGFHDAVGRYAQFRSALESDSHERAVHCQPEIEAALRHEPFMQSFCSLIDDGTLPQRIAHNDAKINNVLLSDKTGEAVCVIDLDTVMPGLALFDFGDMVRTMTTAAAEDQGDSQDITMRMDYYEAIAAGYLDTAGHFLSPDEIAHMPDAGKLLTVETGLRFLTDYLDGDQYFRTSREGQNLDRCRTQFALADSIDSHMGSMRKIAEKLVR